MRRETLKIFIFLRLGGRQSLYLDQHCFANGGECSPGYLLLRRDGYSRWIGSKQPVMKFGSSPRHKSPNESPRPTLGKQDLYSSFERGLGWGTWVPQVPPLRSHGMPGQAG